MSLAIGVRPDSLSGLLVKLKHRVRVLFPQCKSRLLTCSEFVEIID
jgi:hypothetical protein